MTEEPKIVCPKCKSKKTHRIVTGGAGFIMPGTSRGTLATRHGHKKKWSSPTYTESVQEKGHQANKQAVGYRPDNADPYAAFRNKK
jgi:hypothetical protein